MWFRISELLNFSRINIYFKAADCKYLNRNPFYVRHYKLKPNKQKKKAVWSYLMLYKVGVGKVGKLLLWERLLMLVTLKENHYLMLTCNCSFADYSTDIHFDCNRYTNYSLHSAKKKKYEISKGYFTYLYCVKERNNRTWMLFKANFVLYFCLLFF